MKHNYFIQEGQIRLVPLSEEYLELLRRWRNTDVIRKCFLNQAIISSEQQKGWFEKYTSMENDLMFIIEEAGDTNIPVGAAALYNIDNKKHEAEFGRLMIGESSARGKGLGLMATLSLCRFGFNILRLDRIYLEVFSDNIPAVNIYKKTGFLTCRELFKDNKKLLLMEIYHERLINNE